MEHHGRITQIFSSIQGEGPLLATPMIFVRFGGCNLRCAWCDEPQSLPLDRGRSMTIPEITEQIKKLTISDHRSAPNDRLSSNEPRTPNTEPRLSWVSLTGGEPLLQNSFLEQLIPVLKHQGLKIYLETSGIFYEALSQISGWVDLISMDIKLPSALNAKWLPNYPNGQARGTAPNWFDHHDRFLSIAPHKTYVKIVVTSQTGLSEFTTALNLIKKYPTLDLFIIQPATPKNAIQPPSQKHLKLLLELAWQHLKIPIRLLPQHHPVWKIA